ncbi:MAG: hypothetical protein H0V11_07800 [Actinobacteria bacterium]|nr:hypothetical protein [Actinomycetota bacterium]
MTVNKNALARRAAGLAEQRGPGALRLEIARPWISPSGPKAHRQTTLVLRLARSGMVEFVLTRIAPDCRVAGRFRVAGRAGLNRVRFGGRIGGRLLPAGTYRVTAQRVGPHGGAPVRVGLVIVGRPNPLPAEIAAAHASNVCAAVDRTRESLASGPGAGSGLRPSARNSESTFARAGGVLGAQFSKAAEVVRAVPLFLFVVLALAIVLLGLAVLPSRAASNLRLQALLAYHRELVALAGTITLIGVAITYVIW